MKAKKLLFGLALSIVMLPAFAQDYTVDTKKSSLHWIGKKVTGQHDGNIKIKSGEFTVKGNKLAKGTFVIDMPSMTNIDLADNEGMMNQLMGHLKSDDFFGVEKYPEATLEIKKSSSFKDGKAEVTADLTIKDQTHPITFTVTQDGDKFSTTLVIDRTLYNVRYGSGKFFENLGDKTIYDEFTLEVSLVATK